jgi:Transposase IS66 family
LTRFIDDGRIELDNNTVERSIRPIALSRKNALFAGSDGGAEHWATVASLIETCKLNDKRSTPVSDRRPHPDHQRPSQPQHRSAAALDL